MRELVFIVLVFTSLNLLAQGDSIKIDLLNSTANEKNLVFDESGTTLYFTRGFHPLNAGGINDPADIWYSTFNDGQWSIPIQLQKLNHEGVNTVVNVLSAGETLLLLNTYNSDGKYKNNARGLAYSRKTGDRLGKPEDTAH